MRSSTNAITALSASLLDRFDQDGGWALDGALSAVAWVAQRTGSARASLRSRARQGAALRHLPAIAPEARAGRISGGHLQAIAECVRNHPARGTADELVLLEQAAALGAEAFRTATRHWIESADDAASECADTPSGHVEEVSRLHLSRTFEGWPRVDGWFAPHEADLLEAALGAGVDRSVRNAHDGDPSVAGQPVSALRAMALVDLMAQSMRREPSDASVPDRYRVAVVVRRGDPTVPGEAACDATAYRAVLAAAGEVLDVGRQTSRWPVAIRRAITVRDAGCVFAGCDRPPSWCDIHHCRPWRNGGTTGVDNGVLLCRRHHSFVHQHQWRITIENGVPTTRRPDGAPHIIQRWQAPVRAS
jgi:Domain of unknown function (DUF222)